MRCGDPDAEVERLLREPVGDRPTLAPPPRALPGHQKKGGLGGEGHDGSPLHMESARTGPEKVNIVSRFRRLLVVCSVLGVSRPRVTTLLRTSRTLCDARQPPRSAGELFSASSTPEYSLSASRPSKGDGAARTKLRLLGFSGQVVLMYRFYLSEFWFV